MTTPSVTYVENLDNAGITGFADCADPTGNNQPTQELMAKDAHGAVVHTGLFVQIHAGQKFRFVHGNAQGAAAVFELDPATGKAIIVET